MSRNPEMLDIWLSTIPLPPTEEHSDALLLDAFFGVSQSSIDSVAEGVQKGLRAVHLTGTAPTEREKILATLNEKNRFSVEVEYILPDDQRYIAYSVITGIYQDVSDMAAAMKEVLVIAQHIVATTERHLPGF